MKKRLLFSVAGLDRGFAANAGAELAVETAIYSLVGAAGGSTPLTWTPSAPLPLIHPLLQNLYTHFLSLQTS